MRVRGCPRLDTAGSTTYPLQTKDEPIRQVSSASENILKRQNDTCWGQRSVRSHSTNKVREGGGLHDKAEIPLQPIEETMVEQVLPCSLWRGCHTKAVGCFLKEAAAHGKDLCWSRGRSEERVWQLGKVN